MVGKPKNVKCWWWCEGSRGSPVPRQVRKLVPRCDSLRATARGRGTRALAAGPPSARAAPARSQVHLPACLDAAKYRLLGAQPGTAASFTVPRTKLRPTNSSSPLSWFLCLPHLPETLTTTDFDQQAILLIPAFLPLHTYLVSSIFPAFVLPLIVIPTLVLRTLSPPLLPWPQRAGTYFDLRTQPQVFCQVPRPSPPPRLPLSEASLSISHFAAWKLLTASSHRSTSSQMVHHAAQGP